MGCNLVQFRTADSTAFTGARNAWAQVPEFRGTLGKHFALSLLPGIRDSAPASETVQPEPLLCLQGPGTSTNKRFEIVSIHFFPSRVLVPIVLCHKHPICEDVVFWCSSFMCVQKGVQLAGKGFQNNCCMLDLVKDKEWKIKVRHSKRICRRLHLGTVLRHAALFGRKKWRHTHMYLLHFFSLLRSNQIRSVPKKNKRQTLLTPLTRTPATLQTSDSYYN